MDACCRCLQELLKAVIAYIDPYIHGELKCSCASSLQINQHHTQFWILANKVINVIQVVGDWLMYLNAYCMLMVLTLLIATMKRMRSCSKTALHSCR